jgi:hypothetical protein
MSRGEAKRCNHPADTLNTSSLGWPGGAQVARSCQQRAGPYWLSPLVCGPRRWFSALSIQRPIPGPRVSQVCGRVSELAMACLKRPDTGTDAAQSGASNLQRFFAASRHVSGFGILSREADPVTRSTTTAGPGPRKNCLVSASVPTSPSALKEVGRARARRPYRFPERHAKKASMSARSRQIPHAGCSRALPIAQGGEPRFTHSIA